MMKCKACNVKLKCLESRMDENGNTVRRYVCPECMNNFYTTETQISYSYGRSVMNQAERLQKKTKEPTESREYDEFYEEIGDNE